MATEVDICNLAVGHLGQRADITAITPPDGSREARLCSIFYPIARDSLLEKREWGFAKKRALLSETGTPPADWLYQYAMPSNIIRPWAIYINGQETKLIPGGYPFTVENDTDDKAVILTNTQDAVLHYTARITNVNTFSLAFQEALGWWLASYLAGPLTQDLDLAKAARANALGYFGEAGAINANTEKRQTQDNIARRYPIPTPRSTVSG